MKGDPQESRVGNLATECAVDLLPKKNVVGVGRSNKISGGEETGEESITVFVQRGSKAEDIDPEDMIPDKILDVSTDVEEIEPPEPMFNSLAHLRPFMGGDEIGPKGTWQAGTLGMIFRAKVQETQHSHTFKDFGLTNYHVVHYKGTEPDPRGRIMTQPARVTHQTNMYDIGRVYRYAKLHGNNRQNTCDSALIELKPQNRGPDYWDIFHDQLYNSGYFSAQGADPIGFPHYHDNFNGKIRWIRMDDWGPHPDKNTKSRGIPWGLGHVNKGDRVLKHGRTTKLTRGIVRADNYSFFMRYWDGMPTQGVVEPVLMVKQLLCMPNRDGSDDEFNGDHGIVQGGDSGSVVLDDQNHVVGHLYAGARDGSYFIAAQIQEVFKALFTQEELKMVDLDNEIDEGPGVIS